MLEYKLRKEEGRMLHRVMKDVLNKFELAFKEFNTYSSALYIFDNLENNEFEKVTFETKEDIRDGVIALNMVMSYTDLVCINELVDIDNLISTMCIDLYEKI